MQVRVDTDKKFLTANQTTMFTNPTAQPLKEIYFHIYPNRRYTAKEIGFLCRFGGYFKVNFFPEGYQRTRMQIGSVRTGEQNLSYQIEGDDETLLKIALPQPLAPGETVALTIDFKIGLPHQYGRFGWHKNIIQLSRWYPILAVVDEKGWNKAPFYPYQRPFYSEASFYDVSLTVPENQIVIHSGIEDASKPIAEGQKTVHIKTENPIRDFSMAMSKDYLLLSQKAQDITFKAFYFPGNEQHARQALDSAQQMMAAYSQKFGPYPYSEFSIAPVYLGYGGEQMANMIFVDTRVFEMPQVLNRHFDFLISHETGHQWFYNLVGVDEYCQMWLEEGVHSFFLSEYFRQKYGADASILDFPKWCKSWNWVLPKLTFERASTVRYQMMVRMGYDRPIVDDLSSFAEPSSIFALTYGKGAQIVKMLQTLLGRERMDKIFQRIFREYQFKNWSIVDFKKICEQESGLSLDWFFQEWLHSVKKLDVTVRKVQGNRLVLQNRGNAVMPVKVRIRFRDGGEETFDWQPRGAGEIATFEKSRRIKSVQVDPERTLLDVDRTNNLWPRVVEIHPVPIYLGLYDLPVLLPDDRVNVVIGPETANSGLGLKVSVQKPYDQIFYAGTDYEFHERHHHARLGYQLKNVLQSQTTLGVEIANRNDTKGDEEDLASGKVYLRKELSPSQYGLAEINDHATLYVMRNQSLNDTVDFISGREDVRNLNYSRIDEAIVGTTMHLDRSGPYPDPVKGYRLDTSLESAGHFLDATQFFYRSQIDLSLYHPVTPKSTLALRNKYDWGYPDDKDLFHIGGMDGLRGFERKTIRGANAFLSSVEYRFPIKEDLKIHALDNIFGLEKVSGVIFFDAGQAWFSDFSESRLRKDAGLGLRFHVDVGSFLEKVVVRMDVAKAINEPDDDVEFWFGVNHAF